MRTERASARRPGWQAAVGAPPMRTDEIHVWKASATAWTSCVPGLRPALDAAELERGGRFHFVRDRHRFIVAHGLLRQLLAQYSRCAPASLRFGTGPAGKPRVASPNEATPFHFNLSHSADLIVIAIGLQGPLGVDVERWSDDVDPVELAPDCFSPAECKELLALAPGERKAAFFACWSRKEAYIKATGLGVSRGLDYFDVIVAADRPGRILADRMSPGNVRQLHMADLDVGPDYSAALVVGQPDPIVRQFAFDPEVFALSPRGSA